MRGSRVIALSVCVLAFACRRDKAGPRVVPVAGESAVLPRVTRTNVGPEATRATRHTVDVGARKRSYLVVEPTGGDPTKPLPLVFVLHGDGGDAVGFHHAWPFESATGDKAILAYLDGIGRGWDLETTVDNREVAFVEAVIADIEHGRPLDHSRVFATGYSSGGFLANVLACARPGLFRAIASNAGGAPYNQRERWPNGYPKCPGQQPVAMLALHGERDTSVTPDSGRFSAEYWAFVNDCKTDEMETTGYGECRAYRGCKPGKAVAFCSVPSLAHWVWTESAEATWTFFERQ